MNDEPTLRIEDLVRLIRREYQEKDDEQLKRTIRYYATIGVLKAPSERRGREVFYTEGHVDRLRLIQVLKQERWPLDEIAASLDRMTDQEVREELAKVAVRTTESDSDLVRGRAGFPGIASLASAAQSLLGTSMSSDIPPEPPITASDSPAAGPETHGRHDALDYLDRAQSGPARTTRGLPGSPPAPDPPAGPGKRPLASSDWLRFRLAHGLELRARRPATRQEQERLDQLLQMAKQLLKEGDPNP